MSKEFGFTSKFKIYYLIFSTLPQASNNDNGNDCVLTTEIFYFGLT